MLSNWSMRLVRLLRFALPLAAGVVATSAAQNALPRFALPIDCKFGETCFIQHYFDHDPGPSAKDYRCGPVTYDAHDGVDLRVASMAVQRQGVAVRAAAAGTVLGTRDGMDDVSVAVAGPDSVKGRECGNGVTIGHADGWQTQYCHMAKGSVRVRTGQQVAVGVPLGLVGMSGNAEFPHLHFGVSRNMETIDPFAYGAAPGACSGGMSLWSSEAASLLTYHSPEVINSGFVTSAVTMDDVESGRTESLTVATDSPRLIAYIRAIGLKDGDVQSLTLRGPRGAVIASSETPALVRDRAQQLLLVGARLTAAAWATGTYEAEYAVKREGAPFYSRKFTLTLR
jgi:hypothetical protein